MERSFAFFSIGMSVFFVLCAVLVEFYPPPSLQNPPYMRHLLAPLIVAYAVFRFTRAIKILKRTGGMQ